jgi:hypothetical protein
VRPAVGVVPDYVTLPKCSRPLEAVVLEVRAVAVSARRRQREARPDPRRRTVDVLTHTSRRWIRQRRALVTRPTSRMQDMIGPDSSTSKVPRDGGLAVVNVHPAC